MLRIIEKTVAKIAYPLVIVGAIALYFAILEESENIWLATYIPVITVVAVIISLERLFPQQHEWIPGADELRLDIIYMALVQTLLPKALGFIAALLLIGLLDGGKIDIWPDALPPLVQVAMMMLCNEFLRYWLHRLAHEWKPLWRLHSVHHSPKRLYWLNVGRFHPIEKSLQFVTDLLPFIVLGVSENVMALYFVLYAANGFFQHCNIRLEFGWFNYLFSTAELHRWHHSREIEESCKNYGNNLIVWDLLFGTWFLPKGRQVEYLGLQDENYPKGFWGQLFAPYGREGAEGRAK